MGGKEWTSRTSGTNVLLSYVTYGKNQFVVVGSSGTILTSSDGINWFSIETLCAPGFL